MSMALAAIAALLLAQAGAVPVDDGAGADPQPATTTTVDPLTIDRYERLTVPVTIHGENFRFLIDTGAQATAVTRRVTERLALEPDGVATLVAMGSRKQVPTVELHDLEFADRSFSNLTSPLLEAHHIGADGILGLDSLQDLRVLIDFRANSIAVDDAHELGGNTGFEIVVRARRKLGRMIISNATIDGVKTAVIIDTGAQNSVGNLALLRKLRARQGAEVTATDVNGATLTSRIGVARELEIGNLTMQSIPIGFADSPALDALGLGKRPALILGMRNLRLFDRVAIDFATRRVLFDLPRGTGRTRPMRDIFLPSRI